MALLIADVTHFVLGLIITNLSPPPCAPRQEEDVPRRSVTHRVFAFARRLVLPLETRRVATAHQGGAIPDRSRSLYSCAVNDELLAILTNLPLARPGLSTAETIQTALNPFGPNSPRRLDSGASRRGWRLSFSRMAVKVLPVCVILNTWG